MRSVHEEEGASVVYPWLTICLSNNTALVIVCCADTLLSIRVRFDVLYHCLLLFPGYLIYSTSKATAANYLKFLQYSLLIFVLDAYLNIHH